MTDSARTKLFKILISTMFPIILGLVGALYANISKEIDKKASKEEVAALQSDIQEIKSDTKLIIKMHLRQKRMEDD